MRRLIGRSLKISAPVLSGLLGMAALCLAFWAGPAAAQGAVGAPQNWGMGLQEAFGPVKDSTLTFFVLISD